MEMETKIISIKTIKPSSPTPKSLQIHRLSFLDQLAPPIFSHLVYFYSSNSHNSNHLQKSLSEALSRFYPLAGRLVDNLHVDCNNAGVPFFEAEANCDISRAIANRDPNDAYKFIPHKLDESQDLCMAAQATYFRCGGIALGLSISHKIADGLSFALFVKFWSAVASRGAAAAAAVLPTPKFDAAAYFPPLDISGFKRATGAVKEEVVTRTFKFSAATISLLRERYAAAAAVAGLRPSRVEALSAFIWTQFVSATGIKPDPSKIYVLMHSVNLRPRADPSLSEYLFGNMFGHSTTKPAAGDGGVEVMKKVRAAVKAIDGGYVARIKDGEKYLNFMKEIMGQASKGELVRFNFASLCGYPLYEADFGSGKPVWVGHGGFPFNNLAAFMDTKNGDGIDALIHLTKQDMEKFEVHFEQLLLKSNL